MTEAEVEQFVTGLAAVWAAGDSEGFREVWHPDGVLHHVLLDREVAGHEIPRLHRMQIAGAPDLRWTMTDWTWRGDRVIVEFHNSWTTAGGARFVWRGVDALRLKDGKITEERVYADTGPLRAAREGKIAEPLMRLERKPDPEEVAQP